MLIASKSMYNDKVKDIKRNNNIIVAMERSEPAKKNHIFKIIILGDCA